NLSDDLSFNFDKFVPNQKNIIFQGDASVSTTGVLQVTKVSKPTTTSIGRALYAAPIQIWDSITGKVASFATSFSFVVKADKSDGVDGLAFFLAPANSQIPSGSSAGMFGLFSSSDSKSSNQIIAVEFDTYFGKAYNPWDPDFKHIGIDVNSIKSIKTVKWDWRNGEVADVVITYRAPTKSLTVCLSYPSDGTSNIITASVDLKAILPEWVSVGFSGGVGNAAEFETHDVLSWYFTSNLEANN
uniref:LECTIN II n=1 Tax=Ulex europaeus TaxID=3902 RepID=UPI000011025F|nr:Chain A, LECTIN II [Ulex europaeus]1DZQ_B Chain B, LECTIN II [Ulex europaeus]1DZQ_C Chain C, LECTIN II [Ulex europaeus]1DZQ_D Chain D, LECTIN II [Ulex europaeus]1QNW_A Chain A, CHITIN BINDING LECTIN, UEA-II [Ulex europaeus]1QNW_B Chain B, CHITIN BINDING LECTIN, UEA-II [Ulex europaeus]1QNW_C Chain C, CHITIN BINDING LECTIN, UEA-II [Ulex europaeus]1QNW_D Chain D, CHITIN BINDING LECTIN, UEA-II [Ulex europaeus]1QOO_A Chain A, CHITIN BINDING LECTIN, UEA-II [Ulex europaeus]1QOO_B Chain B, CHIT